MKMLGIDYGERKIGLSLNEGSLAFPHSVLKSLSDTDLFGALSRIVKEEGIERVVVGVSEGPSARRAEDFAEKLKKEFKIPVVCFDETLTTSEAQRLSKEAGIKRKKRKLLEDAYAATIMLQLYLDKNV